MKLQKPVEAYRRLERNVLATVADHPDGIAPVDACQRALVRNYSPAVRAGKKPRAVRALRAMLAAEEIHLRDGLLFAGPPPAAPQTDARAPTYHYFPDQIDALCETLGDMAAQQARALAGRRKRRNLAASQTAFAVMCLSIDPPGAAARRAALAAEQAQLAAGDLPE